MIMSYTQAELSIQELDKAMKATSNKNMYKRYQAVRLHFDGFMNIDIANIIQIHPQTVGIYIRKYKEQGLSALTPAPKSGAPCKLSKEQEQQLKNTITDHTPNDVGFDGIFNWTANLAVQWLNKTFGITYTDSGMNRLLHRLNLSYTKPTYSLAMADAEKQEEFKASFEALKKTYSTEK